MEVLRFWSWAPNPRFMVWIEEIKAQLCDILVLTKGEAPFAWLPSPYSANNLCKAASA